MASEMKSSGASSLSETEITLGLLHAVHENSSHTQRSLARELGVALGLANAYLKRCVKKGFIKVAQAPANRYFYYLTPTGFVEKSRLTGEYLSRSFLFFRAARAECTELFELCRSRQWNRIGFGGTGDLCEIAIWCAKDFPVSLAGIVDGGSGARHFCGLPVVGEVTELGPLDAVIVTDMSQPQQTFESLAGRMDDERVIPLPLLKVSRRRPSPEE